MSYDLWCWQESAGHEASAGLTYLRLSDDLPAPGLAMFPVDDLHERLDEALPGWRIEADVPFELEVSQIFAVASFRYSTAEEAVPRFQGAAAEIGLTVFDPQREAISPIDRRTAARERTAERRALAREEIADLEARAAAGDAAAMVDLGVRLVAGEGMRASPARAIGLYERAAALGNVDAAFNLGVCLRDGIGIRRDPTTARRWLEKAAESDEVFAPFALASLYETGDGVERDLDRAIALLEQALAHGHPLARSELNRLRGRCG